MLEKVFASTSTIIIALASRPLNLRVDVNHIALSDGNDDKLWLPIFLTGRWPGELISERIEVVSVFTVRIHISLYEKPLNLYLSICFDIMVDPH